MSPFKPIPGGAGWDVGAHAYPRAMSPGAPFDPPPDPAEVSLVVPEHELITGAHVYPNTAGTCGWVAASLLVRYWHARRPDLGLLPERYRAGTDLAPSPDFSLALQGGRRTSSWARPVSRRLAGLIAARSVPARASWRPLGLGIDAELRAGRPVILFGYLPKVGRPGHMAHAVLVYGRTAAGHYVAHYGYERARAVVLTRFLPGSTTRLRPL